MTLALVVAKTVPNIILILADDLGNNMVTTPQCLEEETCTSRENKIKTPQLYDLASEGLVLTKNHASTPVCMPSRYAFMTGISAGSPHSRIRGNSGTGKEGQIFEKTLASQLKLANYATSLFGKWHFSTPPSAVGFDYALHMNRENNSEFPRFFGRVILEDSGNGNVKRYDLTPRNNALNINSYARESNVCSRKNEKCDYIPDIYHNASLKWMQKQINKKKRFFCYLPMLEPHDGKYAKQLNYYTLPVPRVDGPVVNYKEDQYSALSGTMKNLASAVTNYLDRRIGEIKDFVRRNSIERETLIVFTSDNGAAISIARSTSQVETILRSPSGYQANWPYRSYKRSLLGGGSIVPTIFWWPGVVQRNTVLTEVTDMTDVSRTIVEIAAVEDVQFNGINIFDSRSLAQRRFIFNEICFKDRARIGHHDNCDISLTFTSTQCRGIRILWDDLNSYDTTIGESKRGFIQERGNLTKKSLRHRVPFCSNTTLDRTESTNQCSQGRLNDLKKECIELAEQYAIDYRRVL